MFCAFGRRRDARVKQSASNAPSQIITRRPDMASASVDAPARAILHIDADTFFLAVHERNDPSLKGQTVALWQYNDVICAVRRSPARR